MNIHVEVIPHNSQRYNTVGDWQFRNGDLYIQVSAMGNWKYEALIAHHEMTEALLCHAAGIDEAVVTAFDMEFEAARAEKGKLKKGSVVYGVSFIFKGKVMASNFEPGDHPECPYREQHKIATMAEMQLAVALGVDWMEYNAIAGGLCP